MACWWLVSMEWSIRQSSAVCSCFSWYTCFCSRVRIISMLESMSLNSSRVSLSSTYIRLLPPSKPIKSPHFSCEQTSKHPLHLTHSSSCSPTTPSHYHTTSQSYSPVFHLTFMVWPFTVRVTIDVRWEKLGFAWEIWWSMKLHLIKTTIALHPHVLHKIQSKDRLKWHIRTVNDGFCYKVSPEVLVVIKPPLDCPLLLCEICCE